jgi:hypothetical protein
MAANGLLSAQPYPGAPTYGPMPYLPAGMPPVYGGVTPVAAPPYVQPELSPGYTDGAAPGPYDYPAATEETDHPVAKKKTFKDLIGCNDVLSAVTMLGVGEALNRHNIFNNNSALPMDRVWYGYQSLSDFRTGFGDHGFPTLPLAQYRIVQLQQMGAEIALGSLASIAFQGQYVVSSATNSDNNAWANPQVMFKWAAISTESTIFSPVLAGLIQTPQSPGQVHERTSRIQPGFLFYQTLGDGWFLQGGVQFGIPFTLGATTLEYGLSLGWWLYRDGSLDAAGRRTQTWERTALPLFTGIIPIMEFWGSNVTSGGNQVPLTPIVLDPSYAYSGYSEPRYVYTLNSGVRFLLYNHWSLGLGYSFPLTGRYIYSDGFLASLNMNY